MPKIFFSFLLLGIIGPAGLNAQVLPSRIFTFNGGGQHYKSNLSYDFEEQSMSRTIRVRTLAGIGFSFGDNSYFIFSAGLQYKRDSTVNPITVYYDGRQYQGVSREKYSNLMPAFNLTYRKYYKRPDFPIAFFYQAFLDAAIGEGKGTLEREMNLQWTEMEQNLRSKGSEFEMYAGLNLGFAFFLSPKFSVELSTGFVGYHRSRRTLEYTDLTNRKAISSGIKGDLLNAGISLGASYFF